LKPALLLLLGLALAAPAMAATGGGAAGTQSFKLPRGARPTGMGNAYVAVANGADSILWNPAGSGTLADLVLDCGKELRSGQHALVTVQRFKHHRRKYGMSRRALVQHGLVSSR